MSFYVPKVDHMISWVHYDLLTIHFSCFHDIKSYNWSIPVFIVNSRKKWMSYQGIYQVGDCPFPSCFFFLYNYNFEFPNLAIFCSHGQAWLITRLYDYMADSLKSWCIRQYVLLLMVFSLGSSFLASFHHLTYKLQRFLQFRIRVIWPLIL